MGIEPTSSAWKADILADVRYPHLQTALYHGGTKMSSPNLKKPGRAEMQPCDGEVTAEKLHTPAHPAKK